MEISFSLAHVDFPLNPGNVRAMVVPGFPEWYGQIVFKN
jgi:hypothetical protein